MSLIDVYSEDVGWMVKTKVKDGAGGYIVSWQEGERFSGALTRNTALEARIAEKQALETVFTMTVDQIVPLEYNDVIKRLSDGKIFRITTDADDMKAPYTSKLNIKQATAEKWELTK